MLALYFLFGIISFSNGIILAPDDDIDWIKPGCHKVGHTRKLNVPDCVSFDVLTNACRGFCESWAVPSDPKKTLITQPVTSFGSCCTMMETEPVEMRVWCKEGIRTFLFNSALNCTCFHCRKD